MQRSADNVAAAGTRVRSLEAAQPTPSRVRGGGNERTRRVVDRELAPGRELRRVLARHVGGTATAASGGEAPAVVRDVLSAPGRPLEPAVRAGFESAYGHDLSGVRLHDDEHAALSARAVEAGGYAVGRDVVLDRASYGSDEGARRELLAHELAHVVQQRGLPRLSGGEPLRVGAVDAPAEREAEHAATAALKGQRAQTSTEPAASAPRLRRQHPRRHGGAGHGHPAAAAPAKAIVPDNDPDGLRAPWVTLDQLLQLYVTSDATYRLSGPVPYRDYVYGQDWIRGQGNDLIESVIRDRLNALLESGRRGALDAALTALSDGGAIVGDQDRRGHLRDLVRDVTRDTPGVPHLSSGEHQELLDKTRGRIHDALAAFGYAAQTEKGAIKAELAEQAEMMALFLEIGFSFVAPFLGQALGKGFEKLTEIKALSKSFRDAAKNVLTEKRAEIVVEDVLKAGIAKVKSAWPEVHGQSEAEGFVDFLFKKAEVETDAAVNALSGKTDVEIAAVYAYFDPENLNYEYYLKEIKEKVETFERTVGTIGSIPDYSGYSAPTDIEAGWVDVDGRRRLAIVATTPAWGYDCQWIRWVPNEMADMVIEKSKAEFGATVTVSRDRLLVSHDARDRFRAEE
jgi:Domain of unknown function (DUF4157)